MANIPYTGDDRRGLIGHHANMEEWNAITRIADDTAFSMGQPVSRNGDDGVTEFDGTTLGVTRYHVAIDHEEGFPEGFNVPVMTMGVMWVAAGGTATVGAPAFYDAATDRWSDATGVEVPGVEFDSSAGAGELVKIRIKRLTAVPPAA